MVATMEMRSLADVFAEAQSAWLRIARAKQEIRHLQEQIKVWKTELQVAETALGEMLGRPTEEEEGGMNTFQQHEKEVANDNSSQNGTPVVGGH